MLFFIVSFFSLSDKSYYTKFCVYFVKLTFVNETDNIFLAGLGNEACVWSDNTQTVAQACWISPSMS